jgi:hypothetical protein
MTRQEKINILMAHDIFYIKKDFQNEDYFFVASILQGDGWKQYNNLSDVEIDSEINDRWDDIAGGDAEILALAHKLNGKPIKLV